MKWNSLWQSRLKLCALFSLPEFFFLHFDLHFVVRIVRWISFSRSSYGSVAIHSRSLAFSILYLHRLNIWTHCFSSSVALCCLVVTVVVVVFVGLGDGVKQIFAACAEKTKTKKMETRQLQKHQLKRIEYMVQLKSAKTIVCLTKWFKELMAINYC